MATATIPASTLQSARGAAWGGVVGMFGGGRKSTDERVAAEPAPAAAPAVTRREGGFSWSPEADGEKPAVTPALDGRMSPEEPTRMTAERAAALAEQRALAELAARCLKGDADAWEKLARSQQRRVYGICFRFTGSQTEAEDLTQEAFLKMYRNLAAFDPAKGGFTTWLTTLTRNLLVDNYRRARMDRLSDSLDETLDGEDDGPTRAERLTDGRSNQEKHVAGLELRAQIQEALKQVSPELREAVILRDIEDMDYKDIAEVLGVPQGTVKSRISRGRAELARLLKRLEGQVM